MSPSLLLGCQWELSSKYEPSWCNRFSTKSRGATDSQQKDEQFAAACMLQGLLGVQYKYRQQNSLHGYSTNNADNRYRWLASNKNRRLTSFLMHALPRTWVHQSDCKPCGQLQMSCQMECLAATSSSSTTKNTLADHTSSKICKLCCSSRSISHPTGTKLQPHITNHSFAVPQTLAVAYTHHM